MQNQIEVVPLTLDTSREISYEEIEHILRDAANAEGMAARVVQACFSITILQKRWVDARLWLHHKKDKLYDNPYDVDAKIDLIKTDIPRFSSEKEWLEAMSEIPGFARSTAYARHKEIAGQMQVLGRSFEEAIDSVMLSRSYSKLMLGLMVNENTGVFLPTAVAKLLPEPVRELSDAGVALDAKECRDAILSRMRSDEVRLREGEDIRSVIKDVREAVVEGASYKIVRHPRHINAFVVRRQEGDMESRYVVYIEDDEHQPAPVNVVNWLASRMHVI